MAWISSTMDAILASIETDLRWLAAVAGLGVFAYILYRMVRAQAQPAMCFTGVARKGIRTSYLLLVTLVFTLITYLLWKPIPVEFALPIRFILSVLGAIILLAGLSLYLWGMHALRSSFNVSSGLGVRLQKDHQLVTAGPYAYIRHPMYAGVMASFWGALFLYRTWSMLFLALVMFGLLYRARREEEAMQQAFGRRWELYSQSTPAWLPRFPKISSSKK